MKKWWDSNYEFILFVFGALLIFRAFLFIPQIIGPYIITERVGFLGSIPWANFDGSHYISIAEIGYVTYQQAFFPFFPLTIHFIATLFQINYVQSSFLIVHTSLFIALFILYKLMRMDYSNSAAKWSIFFILFFPASFFFANVYTESLFLMLVLGSFYASRSKKWILAGFLGALASATRLIGIFIIPFLLVEWLEQRKESRTKSTIIDKNVIIGLLIVSIGLISYMIYLWWSRYDPFLFVHAQPAFGAGRSGGALIFLPQVFYRYYRIFTTVSLSNYDYWIALLEVSTFIFAAILLYFALIRKVRKSYLIFSILAFIIPTFSGTFSSLPRYTLMSFAIFMYLATIKNISIKIMILVIFICLQFVLSLLFFQGYFVA